MSSGIETNGSLLAYSDHQKPNSKNTIKTFSIQFSGSILVCSVRDLIGEIKPVVEGKYILVHREKSLTSRPSFYWDYWHLDSQSKLHNLPALLIS